MLINYVTIFGKRDRGGKIKKDGCMDYAVCSSSNQVLTPWFSISWISLLALLIGCNAFLTSPFCVQQILINIWMFGSL